MLGFRYIKTEPTQYVIAFRNGRPVREGAGLSFWYFAPSATIVLVPTASTTTPFIFPLITHDFQEVTVQGQLTWRIAHPAQTAAMLDFSLNAKEAYAAEDPARLSQRLVDEVLVAMRGRVQGLALRDVLVAGEALAAEVAAELATRPALLALGVETLGFAIMAIKPRPDTAKALEAEAREALLRRADEAVYARRNAAVEHERTIRENELATERSVQDKRLAMQREDMAGRIQLETQNTDLVGLATSNARAEADARAYGLGAMVTALGGAEPRALETLVAAGMDPGRLMAMAFRELADNAGKIGQLTVTPDLLREIVQQREGA